MRLGIFGGSFNPVHCGHIYAAQVARDQAQLDQVEFVPCGIPAHRASDGLVAGVHRLKMLQLAIAKQSGFAVSDYELCRNRPSYTVDTVKHYSNTLGSNVSLFLIVGQDCEENLMRWKGIDEILDLASVLVVPRKAAPGGKPYLQERADLPYELRRRIIRLSCNSIDLSSTALRAMVSEPRGKDISNFVPATVESYINEMKLFQQAD